MALSAPRARRTLALSLSGLVFKSRQPAQEPNPSLIQRTSKCAWATSRKQPTGIDDIVRHLIGIGMSRGGRTRVGAADETRRRDSPPSWPRGPARSSAGRLTGRSGSAAAESAGRRAAARGRLPDQRARSPCWRHGQAPLFTPPPPRPAAGPQRRGSVVGPPRWRRSPGPPRLSSLRPPRRPGRGRTPAPARPPGTTPRGYISASAVSRPACYNNCRIPPGIQNLHLHLNLTG